MVHVSMLGSLCNTLFGLILILSGDLKCSTICKYVSWICHYCVSSVLWIPFTLVASGESLHQLPLPRVLMVHWFFYQYSICLDVMRNKDYYWTWLRSFYRYFLKVSTRKLDLQGMLTIWLFVQLGSSRVLDPSPRWGWISAPFPWWKKWLLPDLLTDRQIDPNLPFRCLDIFFCATDL